MQIFCVGKYNADIFIFCVKLLNKKDGCQSTKTYVYIYMYYNISKEKTKTLLDQVSPQISIRCFAITKSEIQIIHHQSY